ncbi:TetR/AcrR family transcriptional regulator [Arthrobacter tumbae]|uniref:TetR/AcrR family transcriptional regulator n=1 Tax=Arthrobacter tumbae TaxID=163874 RepID=UPI00195CF3C1|nr:TetR/AcrR family transcriptional regulator [Arthrobacter tumbae]MBM7780698.1 AcrR family transcriptional regulator [Arthrobacter tumbae]
MAPTPRERARTQTMKDIIRIGREHLAVHGAAALSLRAIARELGLVSSAVYRYVESRDELLTLLVVDAYTELGDEVDHAVSKVPASDYAARFIALARAVRVWAVREPARYALLFGSPVPGYHAPAEQTTGPGTRVIRALVRIYDDAYRAKGGVAALPALQHEAPVEVQLAADLAWIRQEMGLEADDDLIVRGTLVWAALFGVISFEVFGQYGARTFGDPEQLFEQHLLVLKGVVGL